jgi:multidrug efflux system outer membrane protein
LKGIPMAGPIVRTQGAALLGAVLMLSGCTVGPDYAEPRPEAPPEWSSIESQPGTGVGSRITPIASPAVLAEWWRSLEDPVLDSLIERALASNLDLRQARGRVREARARRGVVAGDLFPRVDANASYSRQRNSGTSDAPLGPPGSEIDLYQAGFDASWEIDVFGGVRRRVEAADAELAASVEDERSVLVSLLAEIAQNYAELRGLQARTAIAASNLGAQRETLAMTRSRFEAGLVGEFDVSRAEAQVRSTEAEIPALESETRRAMHRLGVLLGEHPGALLGELSTRADMPRASGDVPIGLPSELLRRRPDIRRAERQLAATSARIGAATADLFPRFSLTGSLGLQSSDFGDLGDSGSRYWSVGPSVSWPVLDFGRIRSNIEVQTAREEQALAAYEQAVLLAFREVEDALVALSKEQARRDALAAAVAADRRAVELATALYRQGLSDFLSVLQAQRDLYRSEDALTRSGTAVVQELIRLYKSLGGGWEGPGDRQAAAKR